MEARVAAGEDLDADAETGNRYWADLVRLLQIFHASGDEARITALRSAMSDRRYYTYIDTRRTKRPPRRRTGAADPSGTDGTVR